MNHRAIFAITSVFFSLSHSISLSLSLPLFSLLPQNNLFKLPVSEQSSNLEALIGSLNSDFILEKDRVPTVTVFWQISDLF